MTRKVMVSALAVCLGVGLAFGQEQIQNEPTTSQPAVETGNASSESWQESLAANASETRDSATDYVIGAEDVLEIDVFGVPELSKTVRVANDGTIALALLERTEAEGLTPAQLARVLEAKWGENYLQNPQVSVFVKEYHAQPVSVIGAVEKPGLYQLSGPRNLIEVLSMAGGLAKRDSDRPGRYVYVSRRGGFGTLPEGVEGLRQLTPEKLEINLQELLFSQRDELNIPIKPLDIISVNKADIVYVLGGVNKAGGFVLEDQESVSIIQAVAMAEGMTGAAAKNSARIIRTAPDGSRIEIPVKVGKILQGEEKDLMLAANDILYIPHSKGKAALSRGLEATIGTLSGVIIYGAARRR